VVIGDAGRIGLLDQPDETPSMTHEMMSLRALIEKAPDADLLHQG
jgi:hypothetical protein